VLVLVLVLVLGGLFEIDHLIEVVGWGGWVLRRG
jgi:hypothetical protein